jgi:DNA-binding transcriptional LysR family regulator
LQVELVVGQAVVDLGGQEADLALRLVAPADPNLVAQKLGELDYAVLGAVDWIKVPVGDLAWVELVAPNTGLGAWHVENAGRVVLRTGSYAALVAAVRAGVGVALMSRGVRLSLPELVVHPGSFRLPPPLPLWRVASPASRSLRRVAVVWEALGGWVREMVAGGAGPREEGAPARQQG